MEPRQPEHIDEQWVRMLAAIAWMTGIAIVLYALPFLNAALGGLVGGARAGSRGRALTAAVASAIVLTGFTLVFRAGFIAPIWDPGRGEFPVLPAVNAGGLVLGALLGSHRRSPAPGPRRLS